MSEHAPPPYSEGTELAVIGAVVVWPERTLEGVLATGLTATAFYTPLVARTWAAIAGLAEEGEPVDPHTVAARCGDKETVADAIAEVGGLMPSHAPAWAELVLNYARARSMVAAFTAALDAARDGKADEAAELAFTALGRAA